MSGALQAVYQNLRSFGSGRLALYGTGASDFGFGVTATGNGATVYVVGQASGGAGASPALLLPFSGTTGNTQGVASALNSASYSAAGNAVTVGSDGTVYVVGRVDQPGRNIYVAALTSGGFVLWQDSYDASSGLDTGSSVALTASGLLFVVGHTASAGTHIIRLLALNGLFGWARTLSVASGQTTGLGTAVDSADNVYVAGYIFDSSGYQAFLTKHDSSSNFIWYVGLGSGGNRVVFNGIAIDSSNNLYVCGELPGTGTSQALLAKYDTSGNLQWQRALGGATYAVAASITVNSAGVVFIAGPTADDGSFIAAYDANGNLLWQNLLTYAPAVLLFTGITAVGTGNLFVTGYSNGEIVGVKVPSDGTLKGSYGDWTYAAATLTPSTPSLTVGSLVITSSTSTLTSAPGGLTRSTPSISGTGVII